MAAAKRVRGKPVGSKDLLIEAVRGIGNPLPEVSLSKLVDKSETMEFSKPLLIQIDTELANKYEPTSALRVDLEGFDVKFQQGFEEHKKQQKETQANAAGVTAYRAQRPVFQRLAMN